MLIVYPHPLLREKAKKISDPQSPEIRELVFEMLEIMKKNNGLGLAAPQAGKSLQLCVIKLDGQTRVFINPRIKSKSWRKEVGEEGCLSFPGQFFQVKRSRKVKVAALDQKGKKIVVRAEGLLARVFQHEIDHLKGILVIDRKQKK